MYSNKNSKAKSKRTQLSAKKQQKNANLVSRTVDLDSQINLISSEQSSYNDNIEAVEAHKQKAKTNSGQAAVNNVQAASINKFNSFNYSRLTKITPPLIQINPQFKTAKGGVIQIVVDDKPLNSTTEQAYKSYTFTREGDKEEFKIRDAFLSDVATKQVNIISKKSDIQKNEKKVLSQETIEKLSQRKKSRYFQVSYQICFKCNKEGHYAKNCINQDMRKCKICFSRLHDQHSCPQTCYECGQSGHISNLCPYSKSQRCERCLQRGHSSSYCGVILRDRQSISNIQSYFSQSDLKKMKCIIEESHEKNSKKGSHFNCFVYKDWPMPYHQLRKTISQNRNSHTSKSSNQKSSYRVHDQGFIFKPGQFQYIQQKRNNQHTFIYRDNRFYSDNQRSFFNEHSDHHNKRKRWKNDEFQQYSRSFEDTKKRSRGRFEQKGLYTNRDMYF